MLNACHFLIYVVYVLWKVTYISNIKYIWKYQQHKASSSQCISEVRGGKTFLNSVNKIIQIFKLYQFLCSELFLELRHSIVTIWNVNVLLSFETAEVSTGCGKARLFQDAIIKIGVTSDYFNNVPYSHAVNLPFEKLEFEW